MEKHTNKRKQGQNRPVADGSRDNVKSMPSKGTKGSGGAGTKGKK